VIRKLSEAQILERGRLAESFLRSKFYKEYFSELINSKKEGLVTQLLKVDLKNWDESSKKMFEAIAKAQFADEIVNTLNEWVYDYKKLIKEKGE